MTTTESKPALFVWDRDYNNTEQVRPYMEQFLKIYQELTDRSSYPYNASFKGRITGIAGSKDEDTGIYLLQQRKSLDELESQVAEFVAAGGQALDAADLTEGEVHRGTVVSYGFYMGGTGWKQYDNVRYSLQRLEGTHATFTYLHVWPARKRNPLRVEGNLLVKPSKK